MHSDRIQVSSRSPERGSTPANNLSSSLNFPECSSPPYNAIFRTVEERDQFPGNVTGFRIYDMVSYSFHILDFNLLNVYSSEMQESSTIPSPDNLVEAHLLLEMAISNCRVQHIQKTLADQLVHHDELHQQTSHHLARVGQNWPDNQQFQKGPHLARTGQWLPRTPDY